VQSDQVELALEAYHDMINNGWKPNEDVLKGLTCVCAKGGQWVLALDFFQKMVDLGTKPNKITYNTLINSLGKAQEVDLAFKTYEHMQAVGHRADAYTIRALLNCLKRTDQFTRSISLFESLKASRNFEMDTEIYNMALVSCQRLGLWEKKKVCSMFGKWKRVVSNLELCHIIFS
jgi:pentatricopeptide repeat protein